MSTSEHFDVSVSADWASIARQAAEIDALARDAIEPNIFYEPWMLVPALARTRAAPATIVSVRNRQGVLTGFFPFETHKSSRGLPLRCLRLLNHDYCFLRTPLISRRQSGETLAALLDWAESSRAPCHLVEFNGVAADGPFAALLTRELGARKRWVCHTRRHERALFHPCAGAETGVSHKHLKELRRVERRLADLGELNYTVLADSDDLDTWAERFLALEASGWKRVEGTAFQSNEQDRAFFLAIVRAAAKRNRLQALSLDLNGVPIAMKCNFTAGEGAFAFKIAHDEQYGRYSPGVLLELFNMRRLHQEGAISWMDSCAASKHFMINRLWTDRRMIANHLLAGRGLMARAVVRYGPRLRDMWRNKNGDAIDRSTYAQHA